MSGIEAVSEFFHNIRPRYSWSSTDTNTLNAIETQNSSSSPHDECTTSLSSAPSSPMTGIDLGDREIPLRHADNTDCVDISHDRGQETRQEHGVNSMLYVDTNLLPDIPEARQSNPSSIHRSLYQDTSPRIRETNPFQEQFFTPSTPPVDHENGPSQQPAVTNQPLAEDDGHRQLRERVMEIQRMDLSEKEQAIRMHELMNKRYLVLQDSPKPRPLSQSSQQSASLNLDPYLVTNEESKPSYYNEKLGILGCEHYRRGVKLQCSSCMLWYPCRFCHDEVQDHDLIRKETKNMLCMHCGKAQPANQSCKFCGKWASRYYCDKCKLWDDDPQKTIYHCNDCGICRIGSGLGKDFFHCKRCGVCMSIELEGQHRCIERSTDCDCPICGEYMFTSIKTVVFMNCGHSIHHTCYNEHIQKSYRCPTCARSVLNMEIQFRFLDHEIDRQPLPEPYKDWHCVITCNDCLAKSDVPFHFLGLKCSNCKSYNTSEVRLIRPEDQSIDPAVQNPLPPPHLMPHPDTATTIMSGRTIGAPGRPTDLASVIREIDRGSHNYRTSSSRGQPPIALGLGDNYDEDNVADDDDDSHSCDTCSSREAGVDGEPVDEQSDYEDENGIDSEIDDDGNIGNDEEDDDDDDDDDDLVGAIYANKGFAYGAMA